MCGTHFNICHSAFHYKEHKDKTKYVSRFQDQQLRNRCNESERRELIQFTENNQQSLQQKGLGTAVFSYI